MIQQTAALHGQVDWAYAWLLCLGTALGEGDRPFAEPGVFVVNANGLLQVVDISNAPFAKPDLAGLAKGLKFIRENDYQVRGRLAAWSVNDARN